MRTHHVLLIADARAAAALHDQAGRVSSARISICSLRAVPRRARRHHRAPGRGRGLEDTATVSRGAPRTVRRARDAASVTDLFVEIRKRVSHDAKEMLPQMAHVGDGDGEFVFIPLRSPSTRSRWCFEVASITP